MSLSALIDAYGTVDERQELIDLQDAAIQRDELLALVKRVKQKIDWVDADREEWYFIAYDIDRWLIDHPDDSCPECGNRPPTICKMSCDTRTY